MERKRAWPVRAEWAPILDAYVRDDGKGLLAVLDYSQDATAMNAITAPAGLAFDVIDLGYANMNVDLSCVPDMPP